MPDDAANSILRGISEETFAELADFRKDIERPVEGRYGPKTKAQRRRLLDEVIQLLDIIDALRARDDRWLEFMTDFPARCPNCERCNNEAHRALREMGIPGARDE